MKILFFGDVFYDFWNLLPVIENLRKDTNVRFGSTNQAVNELAKQNGVPITVSFEGYDMLVVSRMHQEDARSVAEMYYKQKKPIILIEHAIDGRVHLSETLEGKPINYFSVMAVNGYREFDLLKTKFPDKINVTGTPKLDRLNDASQWDKQKIFDLLSTDKFVLVAIPQYNQYSTQVEEKYFIDLPRIVPFKPVYKIHPNHSVERYKRYGQLIIGDVTQTNDITYELINASQAVVLTSSFMVVEASILRKPVILYCHEDAPRINQIHPELEAFIPMFEDYDPKKISSTFDNLAFNNEQLRLTGDYLYDGMNTKRVVDLIRAY